MQVTSEKLHMHEYELLADALCDKLYFHDLSDSSVTTNSLLLSACYRAKQEDEFENQYMGYVGVTIPEVNSWKMGCN